MKIQVSAAVAGGLALALWGGVNSRDLFAQAETGRVVTAQTPTVSPEAVPDDAGKRAALNARLRSMIAEGKGHRLSDAPPAAARVIRAERPANRAAALAAQRNEPASTIAPPPYVPGRAGPVAVGGAYKPPRLDLVTPPVIPSDPVACLTQAIYYEARNESEDGQRAVAEVVLNRAGSGRYPRDICQVVYQRNTRTCQFTFTCDGSIGRSAVNMTAWARAERLARSVYSGDAKTLLPRNSVNYHANYVRPRWSRQMAQVRRIGAHIFYGAPLGGGVAPGAIEPSPPRSLMFVKNDAIERAYAMLTGRSEPEQPAS